MNIKTLLLVPGAIALSLSCLSISPATAQLDSVTPTRMERGFSQLNLTDAQKAQIKQIRQAAKTEIEQLLNTDQRAKMQALQQNSQKNRSEWKSLNLSDKQKQDIRQIMQRSKQQVQAVLTDEQRTLLQQQRQGMKNRLQQRQQQQPGQSQ
jgi:protein CpxP